MPGRSRRYRMEKRAGHPVAMSDGSVYVHRAVLYDKIGPGPHPCHWCGETVTWGAQGQYGLSVAHLDDDVTNNEPGNLVPVCYRCRHGRGEHDAFTRHCDETRLPGPTLSQTYPGEMLPVKVIQLTRQMFTIIDPEDYALVSPFNWQVHTTAGPPYAVRTVWTRGRGHGVRMHVAITGRTWVDHVNRRTLDNRRSNFRAATPAQNLANTRPHRDGTSGFKGVSLIRAEGLWRAQIGIGGKNRSIGRFSTPEDAARAYDHAAVAAAGEYACTNFMLGLVTHDQCLQTCPYRSPEAA